MNAKPVGETGDGGGGGAEDYILIRDEKASGIIGGTFTAGAWQTRDLNTEVHDDGGHASVASNQITLAAGTYRFGAHAPGVSVNFHKLRLYNITDAATIEIGTSDRSTTSAANSNKSFIEGEFTIDASKVIELQHRCSTTANNIGFGFDATLGVNEVYAVIEFWKVA